MTSWVLSMDVRLVLNGNGRRETGILFSVDSSLYVLVLELRTCALRVMSGL